MKSSLLIVTCFVIICLMGLSNRVASKALVKIYTGDSLALLKKEKAALDKLSDTYIDKKNYAKFLIWVKHYNKSKLTKVIKEKFPDEENIEYTYNIVKNAKEQVVMVMAYPTSQSGDWDIAYVHYFDTLGKLIAFKRFPGFLIVAAPVMMELRMKPYVIITIRVLKSLVKPIR